MKGGGGETSLKIYFDVVNNTNTSYLTWGYGFSKRVIYVG